MNRLLIAAAPLAGLLLAACQPAATQKTGVAPVRLDCPEVQGELRRVAAGPDGKSCEYKAGETEVSLKLMPVAGSAEATLATLETDLRRQRPVAVQPVSDTEVETLTPPEPYDPSQPEPPAPPKPPSAVEAGADSERVDIDIPGLKVRAGEEGAQVRIAGIDIDASDSGAEIRRVAYSRLPGEQLSMQRRGVNAFFVLAGENAGPEGYQMVGYQAFGRRDGPLTVAVIRSRDPKNEDGGDIFGDDVRALMKRNGG